MMEYAAVFVQVKVSEEGVLQMLRRKNQLEEAESIQSLAHNIRHWHRANR